MQEVVTGLSGKPDKLYSEGLHVGGDRFVLTKAEDRSLYARKVSSIFQLVMYL
jgi:profilin